MQKHFFFATLISLLSCNSESLPTVTEQLPKPTTKTITFLENLSDDVQSNVIWFSDFEDSSYKKWEDQGTSHEFAGGGIFNTDDQNVTYRIENEIVHSGKHASFTQIRKAINPGEPKAIRLMRWTDKAWNNEGQYFPKEAYYSVFLYFPENFDPKKPENNNALGDGGWWNIFQFKSDNNAGSQPIAVLDLYNSNGKMFLGLSIKEFINDDSDEYVQEYIEQQKPIVLNSKKWVHLEAYYKKATDDSGKISIWQDGQLILEKENFRSIFFDDGTAVWGIGNYTDYVNGGVIEGEATIYFDDAIISKIRIGDYLK